MISVITETGAVISISHELMAQGDAAIEAFVAAERVKLELPATPPPGLNEAQRAARAQAEGEPAKPAARRSKATTPAAEG